MVFMRYSNAVVAIPLHPHMTVGLGEAKQRFMNVAVLRVIAERAAQVLGKVVTLVGVSGHPVAFHD